MLARTLRLARTSSATAARLIQRRRLPTLTPRLTAITPTFSNSRPLATHADAAKIDRVPDAQNKTPEELVNQVPPVIVDDTMAICDGGNGAFGHPVEYIRLNKTNVKEPATCKYCGLRFLMKQH